MPSTGEGLPSGCEYCAWETQHRTGGPETAGEMMRAFDSTAVGLACGAKRDKPAYAAMLRAFNSHRPHQQQQQSTDATTSCDAAALPQGSSVAVTDDRVFLATAISELHGDLTALESRVQALEQTRNHPWLLEQSSRWWRRSVDGAPPPSRQPPLFRQRNIRASCVPSGCDIEATLVAPPQEPHDDELDYTCTAEDLRQRRLEKLRSHESLLLRAEHNAESCSGVKTVIVYSHGFPDAAVTPNALTEIKASELPADRLFASTLPRKWCDGLLKQELLAGRSSFVCFNTRGVPGSGGQFSHKTLTGDIQDLELVAVAVAAMYPNATEMFLCGLSTGAFLSLAAAARPGFSTLLPPPLRLAGVFVLACVADIPTSKSLDFTPEQLATMDSDGWCEVNFWPYHSGGEKSVVEQWRLTAG